MLVTGSKSGEKFNYGDDPYVMLLDEDGEMKWNHHFTQTFEDTSAYNYFTNGKFIQDDKIILVGTGEVFDIISFEWRPIAVMLNHKGKILMQRMYTSVVNEKSHAWFEDVRQLSDGRIIAGGVYLPDTTNAQDTGNQDILIVELDENGCEYPGCQPPLGLEEVMEGEGVSAMHVFPNPGNGHFTIQCQEPVRSWSLTGLDGRLLMAGGNEAAEFEINASHLPAGMYILSVLGQNRQWVKRVVKE